MEKWGQQNRRATVVFFPSSNSLLFWALCQITHLNSTCTWMAPHDLELEQNKGRHLQAWPSKASRTIFPATKGEDPKDRKWVEDGRALATWPQAQPQIPPPTECGLSGKWVFVFHKGAEIWGYLLQYLAYPWLMLKAPESQAGNGWNKMFLKIGMIANKHVCATKQIKIQVDVLSP